tara:strand:- start:125 stop:349 length:225 start_codon:yes stop_codon:yes gene_type:complete
MIITTMIIIIIVMIILVVQSKSLPPNQREEPEEVDPFAGVPEFHAHAQLEAFGKDPDWVTEYIQVDPTEDVDND